MWGRGALRCGIGIEESLKRVHAERELGLVVGRVSFGGHSKTLGESKQLVKATGTRDDERCWVEYNVVRHAVRVRVRDETAVGSIVAEGRPEIKSDEAEVIPCFSSSIVENDESAARSDGVRQKVVRFAIDAVVGRNKGEI